MDNLTSLSFDPKIRLKKEITPAQKDQNENKTVTEHDRISHSHTDGRRYECRCKKDINNMKDDAKDDFNQGASAFVSTATLSSTADYYLLLLSRWALVVIVFHSLEDLERSI